jgi:hypothetical protein
MEEIFSLLLLFKAKRMRKRYESAAEKARRIIHYYLLSGKRISEKWAGSR